MTRFESAKEIYASYGKRVWKLRFPFTAGRGMM